MLPEPGNPVSWQYVREELAALRTDLHGELGGVRTDLADLARDLRAHMMQQGPEIAVIKRRLDEIERDVADLQMSKKDTWKFWGTIAVAVLAVVVSWLFTLIGK
ncbi:hypothetical protein [Amycolatopsis keratiniphila]|uniref:hypothetical protein n=1 Tax=Amycolatopsis keratiniphila TaxID=129921 RepID=UPI000A5426C4|nr:hypothetical protein [Amycolatopsis keratiniphila]